MLMQALQQRADLDPTSNVGFRVVIDATRIGLALDSPRGGDETVEQDGRSVLILDGSVSEFLENLTLDVVQTPNGNQLELRDGG
jgi:hypothetical protein